MSIFAEAAARGLAAAHAVMAEAWALEPHAPMSDSSADPNASRLIDTTRPALVFAGIFFDPSAKPLIPNAFDPRNSQRPGTAGGTPRVEVAPDVVAVAGGIIAGDVLVRQSNGSRWRVNATFTTPSKLLVLHVNAL